MPSCLLEGGFVNPAHGCLVGELLFANPEYPVLWRFGVVGLFGLVFTPELHVEPNGADRLHEMEHFGFDDAVEAGAEKQRLAR